MTFPYYFKIGQHSIHAHLLFESLAFIISFRIFLWMRSRKGDLLPERQRLMIITASIIGAVLGSKILYWLSNPALTLQNLHNFAYMLGGKTIVGGLAGGLVVVELMKKRAGIMQPTGDLFAIPLALGIAIGRIGCFLSGLEDHTYGNPTLLPWGVNFGDGVARHPVQIYETLYLIGLIFWLHFFSNRPHRNGDVFKSFMVFYFGFRLLIEFLKPGIPLAGLTAIQWTCVGILFYYRRDIPYLLAKRKEISHG